MPIGDDIYGDGLYGGSAQILSFAYVMDGGGICGGSADVAAVQLYVAWTRIYLASDPTGW